MGTNIRTIRTLVLLGNMACARRRRSCILGVQSRFGFFGPWCQIWARRRTVVTIPKSCILSIKSCALSDFITPVIYGREAQLGLAIGVYGELFVSIFWSPFAFRLVSSISFITVYFIKKRLLTLDPIVWYLWTLP